jgi:LysR family transcriptional regulator, nitrogen assimilation regulatory protein
MDLNKLRFFVGIVDAGSLSKAAERLFVAQTSLSEHVRALEEATDTKLLVRHARGMRVTPAGKRFYDHSVTILRMHQVMLEDVKSLGREIKGNVSVGVLNTGSEVLSAPLLTTVLSQFPQISLHLVQSVSNNLDSWLGDGKLDLAVVCAGSASSSQRVQVHHLLDETMFVVARRERIRAKRAVRLAELNGQILFCPGPKQGLTKLIMAYAQAQGIKLNVAAQVDSLPAMIGATDANGGYAILPGSAARLVAAFPDLTLTPLFPSLERRLFLCKSKTDYSSPAVGAVQRILLDIVRNLVRSQVWKGARLASTLRSNSE